MLSLLVFVHKPIEVKFKISVACSGPFEYSLSTHIRLLIFCIHTFHSIIFHNIHLIYYLFVLAGS
jgi:hypothetical protein